MSGTSLRRAALDALYDAAVRDAAPGAPRQAASHPGLLLQRGLREHSDGDQNIKTEHVERICKSAVADFYRRAFERWKRATADASRFRVVALELETRLFIGLTGGGMLETGCAVSHSYGTPYISGSSVKGVVGAYARNRLGAESGYIHELFGVDAEYDQSAGSSGLLTFHDAWWKPGSADFPLVREVVTTHHKDYYGKEGEKPATDFDSPVPNAQIAVRGGFLFVVEGPADWLEVAGRMLVGALTTRGAGAKTRAGYGLFRVSDGDAAGAVTVPDPGHDWVEAKLEALSARPGVTPDQALRGKSLAEAWSAIEDPDVKEAAHADIRARWTEKGWWSTPQGGAAKKAKAIYDAFPALA